MAFLQEYTMLDELGKGGFATVYKVRHNELGYIRAVRVLNETIIDSSSETYQNFLRECKVLLRLGNGCHPNIVHIYQPRLLESRALVEMDYVDGQDIRHYLRQNQNYVTVEDVIKLATQISSALAFCHEDIYHFCMDRDTDKLQDDPNDGTKILVDDETRKRLIEKYKVIHNDIHSGNIMRREDGNFVLLDFGLAIEGKEVICSSCRHSNGVPEFKAPEKWNDESILTEQSDIYSFGIVLYQYLAGRVPFPYNFKTSKHIAEYELAEAHQKATPPSIESIRREQYERKFNGQHYERDYPQWLEDVILKCLRKNPAERFKNGKELYEYIMAQQNHPFGNDISTPPISDKKCPKCGTMNHKDAKFCSKCGNLFIGPSNSDIKKYLILIIAIIIAIIVGIVVYRRIFNNSPIAPDPSCSIYRDTIAEGTVIEMSKSIVDASGLTGETRYYKNSSGSIILFASTNTKFSSIADAHKAWENATLDKEVTYNIIKKSFCVISWWDGDEGHYYRAESKNGHVNEWHLIWKGREGYICETAKKILNNKLIRYSYY